MANDQAEADFGDFEVNEVKSLEAGEQFGDFGDFEDEGEGMQPEKNDTPNQNIEASSEKVSPEKPYQEEGFN